jgi:hypothetical protein
MPGAGIRKLQSGSRRAFGEVLQFLDPIITLRLALVILSGYATSTKDFI